MRYLNVCLEAFGYTLPDEVVTSDQIERRLQPLYDRLRLPQGRLELITGIRQRRFWAAGTLPSEMSVASCQRALLAAELDRRHVGALIHASVCRDHLEPATACSVHHQLDLPGNCLIYDLSNACLGLLNGIIQVANMIELGQIRAGLVVGTEGSRQLVETTIDALNSDLSLTRQQIKSAVASLTIGSASCAVLLTDRELSRTGNRLLGGTCRAETRHHRLCHSGRDEAVAGGMQPLMQTDSEQLMREGIEVGSRTFERFLESANWRRERLDRTFCHQVGSVHRKLLLDALRLDAQRDFTTVEWLGNTGSAALPVTMAIGLQRQPPAARENVALLGIGSGINCLMLAAEMQHVRVQGCDPLAACDERQSSLAVTNTGDWVDASGLDSPGLESPGLNSAGLNSAGAGGGPRRTLSDEGRA
ncbi:MAG: 3-oxoacyl-ACP synthase III [Pirellulaceae bacterium]|nr:3-oxoacyl-ACP synthase III [Pirellulaceae bacterium]